MRVGGMMMGMEVGMVVEDLADEVGGALEEAVEEGDSGEDVVVVDGMAVVDGELVAHHSSILVLLTP